MKSKIPIINKLLIWLRGDYNSVIYRFLVVPRERLTLILFRFFGYSWIDFYARRLNKFVLKNDKKLLRGYSDLGEESFSFLIKKGLKPHNSFLDFGCGYLRLGIALIPYLKKAKYTGIDIAKERVDLGIRELEKKGIKRGQYNTYVSNNNSLSELLVNRKFDFIYLESVVTHMPLDDFKEILRSFSIILEKNGKVFFTFHASNKQKKLGVKDFYYPFKKIKEVCQENGFLAEIDNDWHEKDTPMVRLVKNRIIKN